MTRVIILDDQEISREGYRLLLEKDPEVKVVGCTGNVKDILSLCEKVFPDVILLTFVLPLNHAANWIKSMKEKRGNIKLVLLNDTDNTQYITSVLNCGVDIFLSKDIKPDLLLHAIKNITEGMCLVQQKFVKFLLINLEAYAEIAIAEENNTTIKWTENERAIINLIAQGKCNKEIASIVHLSEGRIKNIITGIMKKLKLNCRTQIAVYAVRNRGGSS